MGEANSRGTFEERREQALDKMIDTAEVLIALSADGKEVRVQMLTRDAEPDQESVAVILASFLNANIPALMRSAMDAKLEAERKPAVITDRPVRSIQTQTGNLAQKGDVELLGPDGRKL